MHTCPSCGQACYCNGDIEDHDTGDDVDCDHWLECEDDELFDDEEIALPAAPNAELTGQASEAGEGPR